MSLAILTTLALFVGPLSVPARAQSYDLQVNVLQESGGFLFGLQGGLFHDIFVGGTITVNVAPPDPFDTISVIVSANDTGTVSAEQLIFPAAPQGTVFALPNVGHLTLEEGSFTVVVASSMLGELFRQVYPVPAYDVSVGISSTLGEVGTQFVVETFIDLGAYTVIDTTFDIEYTLDGRTTRESESAFVIDTTAFVLGTIPFPRNDDYLQWRTTQTFTLDPGVHNLDVRVFDRSIVAVGTTRAAEVHAASFTITVTDQVMALQEGFEDRFATIESQTQGLTERADFIEQSTAITSPLAWLSIVAIGLSTVTLLIQFGILKIDRFRRGPVQPGEPEEPGQPEEPGE